MATESLRSRLRYLGRRLLGVNLAAGLGWGLAAAVVLLLGCVWLDLLWELPPHLRQTSAAGGLVVTVLLAGAAGWRALRHGQPRILAQRLDHAAQASGEIVAGVDLALEPPSGPALTAGLADLAVARAGQLAADLPSSRAVPLRPVYWSFGGLAMLAAVVGLAAVSMPRLAWAEWLRFADPFGDHPLFSRVLFTVQPGDARVVYGAGLDIHVATEGVPVERLDLVLQNDGGGTETLPLFPEASGQWRATLTSVTSGARYFVRARAGRSRSFRIEVITVPRLEAVRFHVTPPAYTSLPPYNGPLPQGGLAGLPGTQVQVWARSNRPLSGGMLEIPGPERTTSLALMPVGPEAQEATASFKIVCPGKLQLRVIDTNEQSSAETFTAPIAVLTDERPFIRLLEPPPLSFATPQAALPVVLAAEDDYGISRVQLFRSLNESRALALDLPVPAPAPTRWTQAVRLPLSEYGLSPGDEIKLFGRVEDNNPAGPQGSESTVAVVRIISVEDYQRLVRARQGMEVFLSKYRQAQRRAEQLAEEVERLRKKAKSLPADAKAAEAFRQEMARLAERFQREADAVKKAGSQELPYDLDKALAQHLENMGRQLQRLSDESQSLARSRLSPGELAHLLERMLRDLGNQREALERETLEPLEHLAVILPLLEDAARFVIVYERQKGLAQRLASFKGPERAVEPGVRARMRDLQSEQQEIRSSLTRLLDDIEDHVARLPEDPKLEQFRNEALDFAKTVRLSGASEAMTEAETALGEFFGQRAHAVAGHAADILEQFIERAQGSMMTQGQLCLRFQPILAKGLGDTVAQMLADMGLPMPGQAGGQGGYSARRSTMENVGLYGTLPTQANDDSAGAARGERAGAGRRGRDMGGNAARPSASGAAGQAQAGGAAEASVPLSYRRRVAEYFQRIADETGGR
jgi:hypothetical protein